MLGRGCVCVCVKYIIWYFIYKIAECSSYFTLFSVFAIRLNHISRYSWTKCARFRHIQIGIIGGSVVQSVGRRRRPRQRRQLHRRSDNAELVLNKIYSYLICSSTEQKAHTSFRGTVYGLQLESDRLAGRWKKCGCTHSVCTLAGQDFSIFVCYGAGYVEVLIFQNAEHLFCGRGWNGNFVFLRCWICLVLVLKAFPVYHITTLIYDVWLSIMFCITYCYHKGFNVTIFMLCVSVMYKRIVS